MGRLAQAGKKLLLLGISLLVAFVLVEILLRVVGYSPAVTSPLTAFHQADEQLGWVGTPNHTSRFKTLNFDALVETDDEGFRKVVSSVTPPPEAPEIWLLGDSTTWGWGVSNEEMWASVLQEKIGSAARIRNFGMNAYGSLQEALLFERLLEERDAPRTMLLMVCNNDFTDNLTDQDGARPYVIVSESGEAPTIANRPVERKIGGLAATIAKHSYAVSFVFYCSSLVKQIRKRGEHEQMFAESWEQADKTPKGKAKKPLPDEQIEAMRFAFQEIDALCRKHEIDWKVIPFPQATTRFAKPATTLALEEIVSGLEAEIIDLESEMADDRRKYYIGDGDFHWNAEGNRMAAKILAERIRPGSE